MQTDAHWTAGSSEAFAHAIAFDFIAQLEKKMEEENLSQADLAKKLGVTEGAVSKILNSPQNLTLKTMVAYARSLGIKVAVVAYDDNDPEDERGPVNSEVFTMCWERSGKPCDFWSLKDEYQTVTATTASSYFSPQKTVYALCGSQNGFQILGTGSEFSVNVSTPFVLECDVASRMLWSWESIPVQFAHST